MVAMSNNYWDDEDDNDDTIITGNETESDLQKKLRKKIRSDEKRIKDLEEKLSGYTVKEREAVVKSVLEKQGVNPKAARLALKDLEDVSEDSVLNWLDDNGDLFGYSKSEEAPIMSEEDFGEVRRQNTVTQGAKTPDRGEDLELRIDQAQSAEELANILYSSNS
jgi:hypothetical protein